MAERSKAPDSRGDTLSITEHSGPRMWAWVRIPLLTLLLNEMPGRIQIAHFVHRLKVSTEPDLNQGPKDYWQVTSTVLRSAN